MTKRWLMSLLLGCLLLSLQAKAQTFEDGYQSYVRNQFPVAELQFKNALRKANADEDKAVLLKFIGICQYMRGDKKNAQATFGQALYADRSIAIESEDVLDPSVITYFMGIKAKLAPELKKKQKQAPPTVAKSTVPVPVNKPKPKPLKTRPTKSKSSDSIMGLSDGSLTTEERSKKISYMQFLPFGFPQFHNESYWIGAAFAAGQIFSIYSILDADKAIKGRQGLNDIVANKEGLSEDQRQAFYLENNNFIKKVQSQKTLALAAFGSLWAASVVESIWFHKGPLNRNADRDGSTSRNQNLTPIIQTGRSGRTFGLSWQAKIQ